MIIYVSMLVVVFIGFCLQKMVVDVRGHKTRAAKFLVFLTFGYIIFWAGIRDRFIDTASYIVQFKTCQWNDLKGLEFSFDDGWGFKVLMIFFKTFISENYHAWLMFIAIVSGTCVAYIFWRYSQNYYYTLFLFITLLGFTWMMNGIRQFLAATIIFACTPWIEEKKSVRYCLVVLLCATIHPTCIIMLPIYFIVRGEAWSRKTLLFIALTLIIIFFTAKFTNIMDAMLQETKWANVTQEFANDDGVNPLRVLVFSVPVFLAFIGRKRLKREDLIIHIFINMSILTVCLYAIGMVTTGILVGRLPIYIEFYGYIILPSIIEKCFTRKSQKLLYGMSIVCYLFYFYLMTRGMYYSSELTGIIWC